MEVEEEVWDRIILAIDAPLTLPEAYRDFIARNEIDKKKLVRQKSHIDSPFFFRDCDRYFAENFDKPLPVVGSWMGNNSTMAQLFVSHWTEATAWKVNPRISQIPEESEVTAKSIIEVYPATAKENNKPKELKERIDSFLANTDAQIEEFSIDDDEFDAAICAVHALAYASTDEKEFGLPELIEYKQEETSHDYDFPREEGWIYHFNPNE